MEQDITITKEIVNYFYDNLPSFDSEDTVYYVKKVLEQNNIAADQGKIFTGCIINELNNLPREDKYIKISNIIFHLLKTKTKYWAVKKSIDDNFINLCLATKDKLYLNPYLEENDIKEKKKKYKEIEFYNSTAIRHINIVKDKLKILPIRYRLKKSEIIHIEELFHPFLHIAKSIIFYDPYISNETAFLNFEKIFEKSVIQKSEIKIFNLSEENILKNQKNKEKSGKSYNIFNNYINAKIKSGYKIQVNNILPGHRERYIKTERIMIKLPGGLDCINKDCKPSIKDNYDIKEIEITEE